MSFIWISGLNSKNLMAKYVNLTQIVSDFFRFRETDPKEVMVTLPQELYRAPRNESVIRSGLRRSFRFETSYLLEELMRVHLIVRFNFIYTASTYITF